MGQSLSQMYVHLTFGTKGRAPVIRKDIAERLHAYLAGTLKKYESPVIVINSVADHVHILFRLSKNYSLARIIDELKKQSSRWIKMAFPGYSGFSWQNGYGAFSVSSSALETVKQYIVDQEMHHKRLSYKREVEDLIKLYGITEYTSEYFWK